MKIRIKGNSIRLRLTKSEVERLAAVGHIEEQTKFAANSLVYILRAVENNELTADFSGNTITVSAPKAFLQSWPGNAVVGLDAKMQLPGTDSLYILIEKDFVCLDATTEDQSDNYENPNKSC